MTIYQPLVSEGYEWVNASCDADYEVVRQLDGTSRVSTWKPIRVRRVNKDEGQAFKPSDFPWLGSHALVMRGSAVSALRDLLETHGELLPLVTSDGVELFVYNVKTVDALDEANSSLEKFPGTERIMLIKKVAFVASAIRGVEIFRIPHRATPTNLRCRPKRTTDVCSQISAPPPPHPR